MELIALLLEAGIDFVMRVREKFDLGIDAVGCGDQQVRLEKGGRGPIEVRVVKFRLSGGETETLLSSLMDSKRYTRRSFKALYFKRWVVETKYDGVKQKLEVENFSGILADNNRQDFYAAMTQANIAGGL